MSEVSDPPLPDDPEPEDTDIATVFELHRYLINLIQQGHPNMHVYIREATKEYHVVVYVDHGRLYIDAGNPALLMME